MKYRILVTGMKYQCQDNGELTETIRHLETDKPELCLIRKTTHAYGVVVEAKELKEVRKVHGVVSRFDLLDTLELMRLKGFGILKCRVVDVCSEGSWFSVEVDAPDEFKSCKAIAADCWNKWVAPDIPLMLDIPCHGEVESSIAYLEAALHCPEEFDRQTTAESLRDLIDMSRYDVTLETQMALKSFRLLVDTSADSMIRSVKSSLVQAINDMGSHAREEEYETIYYQMIVDSDEATDMINAWYSTFAYTKTDDMTLEEIRRSKLRNIEHSLQSLPDELYREVDRKGHLLHLLLYKGIPYEKYRALMSALVMRDHLLDELETVIEFDAVVEEFVEDDNILNSPDAQQLWTIAREEHWVDDNNQPIMNSQPKAAILASVMADCIGLSPRWEPFEKLWGIKDLATKFCKAQDCSYYPDTMKSMINALR